MVGSPRSPTSPSNKGQAAGAKSPSSKGQASPKSPSGAASSQSAGPTSPLSGTAEVGAENEPIAAEDYVDNASDLDSDVASSSASIMSSVLRYRFENGRRYHAYKEGSYVGPNDEVEKGRLDLQHHMCRELTFGGKLFNCPADPEKMNRVLDCGTGTGIWAIDLADDYPNIEVTGVDLSAIQPDFVPPNVRFYVDDLEDNWTYSHPFDLIYSRMLTGSLADFPRFFQQCYEQVTHPSLSRPLNLVPGGWVECLDGAMPLECDDGTMSETSAIREWTNMYLQASEILGRPMNSATRYAEQMRAAGFINVVEKKYRWPTNPWPRDEKLKELGLWTYENIGRNLSGLSLALFTRAFSWTTTQLEVYLVDVRREMKDPNIHAYVPIWVVYGQKPPEA